MPKKQHKISHETQGKLPTATVVKLCLA